MRLEATKFRPREVIKHVLQTAAASLKKMLILEGHVADDIPLEVRSFEYRVKSQDSQIKSAEKLLMRLHFF